jgi:Leucine-rich repeat (LRR) protein
MEPLSNISLRSPVILPKRLSRLYEICEYIGHKRIRLSFENNYAPGGVVLTIYKSGDPVTIIGSNNNPTTLTASVSGSNYTALAYSQLHPRLIYIDITDPDNILRIELINARGWLGDIAEDINKFPNIERLAMPNNDMSGYVPDLSKLKYLTHLLLNDNRLLIGPPPSVRSAYATLQQYRIDSCGFEGSFDDFSNFTAITIFDTSGNSKINGSIPILRKCSSLVTFNIRSCSISDNFPEWLNELTSLVTLRFDQNNICGSISSLTGLNSLVTFNVNNNPGINGYTASTISVTCTSFTATSCSLPQSAVDQILADFVTNLGSRPVGTISLGGSGNAAPSAAGIVNKNTLVTAGWTVTTN